MSTPSDEETHRDDLERACWLESSEAQSLHDDARLYLAGDITPEEFLNAAYYYGKARMERERLQAEAWP